MIYTIENLSALNKPALKDVATEFGITRRFVHNAKKADVIGEILARQLSSTDVEVIRDSNTALITVEEVTH
jgi:hypothetical protein